MGRFPTCYLCIFLCVAAFGGLVGLCIGFSILSGVEIIYWFTLRLYLDHFKGKWKKRGGE